MKRLNEMTDEELALSYIDGNNRAFDLLLSRNQSKVYSYILFVVRDKDVANDIFQDTFVKVICKLREGRYEDTGRFSAWVMRIAHNVMMDWYRQQHADHVVEATEGNDLSKLKNNDFVESNIENRMVNQQVLSDVKHIMECLPTTQREVVFMRFFQQMSFKEIAETTNVSINTSLGRMRYAIMNMRRMAKQSGVALQLE